MRIPDIKCKYSEQVLFNNSFSNSLENKFLHLPEKSPKLTKVSS